MKTGEADGPRPGLPGWVLGHIASKPWRFAAAGLVVLLAVVLLAWQAGFDRAAMAAAWEEFKAFLQAHPWALFVALVVLPGLPFPVSALLLAAGVAWSDHPVWACGVCLGALAINISWTYWAAAYPGRKLVERLIRWSRLKIPEVPPGDQLGLILVMRLTPGIPLFFQNYVLGFVRAPFRLYLPLSILINGAHACGFVLVGAGMSDGRLLPVASGAGLVVAAVIVTRWLRARVVARRERQSP